MWWQDVAGTVHHTPKMNIFPTATLQKPYGNPTELQPFACFLAGTCFYVGRTFLLGAESWELKIES